MEENQPLRRAADEARLPQGAYSSLPGQAAAPPAVAVGPSRAPLIVAAALIGALALGLALKMSQSAPPPPTLEAVTESAPLDGASVAQPDPAPPQAPQPPAAAVQALGPAPSATPLEEVPNPILEAARELAGPRHGTMGSGELEGVAPAPPRETTPTRRLAPSRYGRPLGSGN